jgi:DNA-binding transcriptional regulator YbjK
LESKVQIGKAIRGLRKMGKDSSAKKRGRPAGRAVSPVNAILNSTIGMLGKTSIESVLVASIASQANVSVSTIYYHFVDRETLLAIDSAGENIRCRTSQSSRSAE